MISLSSSDASRTWGLTVLRVVVGVVFLMHGGQKLFIYGLDGVAAGFGDMGFPLPALSAALVIAAEFLGGLLLILGLFTRVAAVPLAVTMLVAGVTVHGSAFFLPDGFEYVLVLLAASVTLILSGAGALALDNVLARRLAAAGQRGEAVPAA